MAEASGAQWCDRFPTSNQVGELAQPFRDNVAAFIAALKLAKAKVTISATYRPVERAYLMHWCCMIADSGQDPLHVPAMHGVDIDWGHNGDVAGARHAAREMKAGYNIAFPAALTSRHTQRRAVDMTVTWSGVIKVVDKNLQLRDCDAQADLYPIGKTYGVLKLLSDPPHWSDDGH